MKIASSLVVPLVIAVILLGAAVLLLPQGAAARDDQPTLTEKIEPNTGPFGDDDDDRRLSFQGGNLPRVAANGSFVALVYEQNNRIFIRGAQAPAELSLGWTNPPTLLDSTRGNAPRLAFSPVGTDTLHVVWTGYGGSNPEVPETVIRHTQCTLAQSVILCDPPHEIDSAAGAENLKQPDVAVDEDGRIHVAWFDENGGGVVRTALSETAASDWSLSSVPIAADNLTDAGRVALATAGGFVHLAFRDNISDTSPTAPWQVKYVRTAKTAHTWGMTETFGEVLNYGEIRNPAIAAGGSKVQIVWDTEKNSNDRLYALLGASSADSGATWPDADKRDIPSNAQVVLLNSEPISKPSSSGPVRVNEALRPSVAVTDTNNFAVVWQQLPYIPCNPFDPLPAGPHPSQIFAAVHSGNSWAVNGQLSDNRFSYKVGPDLAVDNQGTHFVFMMVDSTNCSAGLSTDYTIYYRGPYTEIQISRISYLPVIVKVN